MASAARPTLPGTTVAPSTALHATRGAKRGVVVLFLLLIALPLGANLAGRDGADAAAENRELAAFPRAGGSIRSWLSVPIGFSDWFEDHFGFRAALVRSDAEAKLFGLHVSPSDSVMIGRDGWFFYADDGAVEDFAGESPMGPELEAAWRETMTRASRFVKRTGGAYVFTIAPDKHLIYPEEVPPTLRRLSQTRRLDAVFQTLSTTSVATVDVRPALEAARQRERVYQKTDTHWNDRGALVAYQEIIAAVRRQKPEVPLAWTRDDFEPVERTTMGMDLARMMGLSRVLQEVNLTFRPLRQRRAQVVKPAGAEPTDEEGEIVTEIPGSTLPRAVIFRDSFSSRLVPFLSEHFSRAVYLWQNDFDADVVRREHADVVIQEIVGRHLYGYIPSPELIPDHARQ